MNSAMDALEQTLQQSLTLSEPLLRAGASTFTFPEDAARRHAIAMELLQSLINFLEESDKLLLGKQQLPATNPAVPGESFSFLTRTARQVFDLLLSEWSCGGQLGIGGNDDRQLQRSLLHCLPRLSRAETRQLILDWLPYTSIPYDPSDPDEQQELFLQEEENDMLEIFRQVIVQHQSAFLPILECLASIPLSEAGRQAFVDIALKGLTIVVESELATVVQALLKQVATTDTDSGEPRTDEAMTIWKVLRKELQMIILHNNDNELEEQRKDPEGSFSPILDKQTGDDMVRLAQVVISSFSDPDRGRILAQTYLQTIDRIRQFARDTSNCGETTEWDASAVYAIHLDGDDDTENHDTCLFLDFVVLLVLSQRTDHVDDVERIWDAWIASDTFPFATLTSVLSTFCSEAASASLVQTKIPHPSAPQQEQEPSLLSYFHLAPALLQLCIFLMLAPARVGMMPATRTARFVEQAQAFALDLHDQLDRERQSELVQSMLHLTEELAFHHHHHRSKPQLTPRKRKRSEQHFIHTTETPNQLGPEWKSRHSVHSCIHGFLKSLAETSPGSLLRFKHILLARLTSPTSDGLGDCHEESSTRKLCSILAHLVQSDRTDGLEVSEVMMALQKLLFSSTRLFGGATGDNTHAVRGLLLATEMLRATCLGQEDQKRVQEWVLRILLPPTRRMIDPELGSPGLQFLEVWMNLEKKEKAAHDKSQSSKNVFQHFRILLANTGLIQRLENYLQRSGKTSSFVLAYADAPRDVIGDLNSTKKQSNAMVFCLSYFNRRADYMAPSKWLSTARWVFDLVDTYLRLGRETAAQNWRPEGWLLATIEIPKAQDLMIIFDESGELKSRYFNFDLMQNLLNCAVAEPNLTKTLSLSTARQCLSLLISLSASFWIGITLSCAVLKNTFAHWTELYGFKNDLKRERRAHLTKLIQYQMTKIFDMRKRALFLEAIFQALKKRFSRRSNNRNGSRKSGINDGNEGDDESKNSKPIFDKFLADLESALSEMHTVDNFVFISSDYVDAEAAWHCLMDENDERLLHKSLQSVSAVYHELPSLSCIIKAKECMADYLTCILRRLPRTSQADFSWGKRFSHCYRTLCVILGLIPEVRAESLRSLKVSLVEMLIIVHSISSQEENLSNSCCCVGRQMQAHQSCRVLPH